MQRKRDRVSGIVCIVRVRVDRLDVRVKANAVKVRIKSRERRVHAHRERVALAIEDNLAVCVSLGAARSTGPGAGLAGPRRLKGGLGCPCGVNRAGNEAEVSLHHEVDLGIRQAVRGHLRGRISLAHGVRTDENEIGSSDLSGVHLREQVARVRRSREDDDNPRLRRLERSDLRGEVHLVLVEALARKHGEACNSRVLVELFDAVDRVRVEAGHRRHARPAELLDELHHTGSLEGIGGGRPHEVRVLDLVRQTAGRRRVANLRDLVLSEYQLRISRGSRGRSTNDGTRAPFSKVVRGKESGARVSLRVRDSPIQLDVREDGCARVDLVHRKSERLHSLGAGSIEASIAADHGEEAADLDLRNCRRGHRGVDGQHCHQQRESLHRAHNCAAHVQLGSLRRTQYCAVG